MSARTRPNIVDSSGWLEFFADTPAGAQFARAIEATGTLIVPAVCILEVFRVILRARGEGDALQAAAAMHQGQVVVLDSPLALMAAKLGVEHKLPLADSIVYATGQHVGGIVWTQDDDFDGLADVQYFPKGKR